MIHQDHQNEQRIRRVVRQEIKRANHRRLEDEASDRRLSKAISEMESNERYWADQMKGRWKTR